MLITRKPARFASSPPPLYTFGHPIWRVFSYRYIGVLITPGLLISTPLILLSNTHKFIGFLTSAPTLPRMPFSKYINLLTSLTGPLFETHLTLVLLVLSFGLFCSQLPLTWKSSAINFGLHMSTCCWQADDIPFFPLFYHTTFFVFFSVSI